MKNSDIALILLRVLAVYLILSALSIVSTGFQMASFSDNLLISQTTVLIILSVILWFVAPFIARLMVKKNDNLLNNELFKNKTHVESSIFMTVGLILLVTSLPALIFNFAYYNTDGIGQLDEATKTMFNASKNGMIASYAFKSVIGVFLIIFSGNIIHAIIKLRTKLGFKKIK